MMAHEDIDRELSSDKTFDPVPPELRQGLLDLNGGAKPSADEDARAIHQISKRGWYLTKKEEREIILIVRSNPQAWAEFERLYPDHDLWDDFSDDRRLELARIVDTELGGGFSGILEGARALYHK